MKCVCGAKLRSKEARGNDYVIYRIRHCEACEREIVTQEIKMDYNEGLKMIRKIFYNRYIKKPSKKRRRRNRE